jgi:hypothetical protein
MRSSVRTWSVLVVVLAAVTLGQSACTLSADAQSALTDWFASSAGSLIQILVNNALAHDLATGVNVDPTLPISQQYH